METSDDQGTSRQAKKKEKTCKFCEIPDCCQDQIRLLLDNNLNGDKGKKLKNCCTEIWSAFRHSGLNNDTKLRLFKQVYAPNGVKEKCCETMGVSLSASEEEKGHKNENESLKKQENIIIPTKRKFKGMEASTTVFPSKKSRQETLINEALGNNSDDVSSSQKKSKNGDKKDKKDKDVSQDGKSKVDNDKKSSRLKKIGNKPLLPKASQTTADVRPSKKSRPEALENNFDDVSSSQKKSKSLESIDMWKNVLPKNGDKKVKKDKNLSQDGKSKVDNDKNSSAPKIIVDKSLSCQKLLTATPRGNGELPIWGLGGTKQKLPVGTVNTRPKEPSELREKTIFKNNKSKIKKNKNQVGNKKDKKVKNASKVRKGQVDTTADVRLSSRKLLTEALRGDGKLPEGTVNTPEELSELIEKTIFKKNKSTNGKYRNQVRSRVFNLTDKKNPSLRENVLCGVISTKKIAVMTSEMMASEEVKKQRESFVKEGMKAVAHLDMVQGTKTELFKCGKCGKKNCTYKQIQTRKANKAMTNFVWCNECGNRWKFC